MTTDSRKSANSFLTIAALCILGFIIAVGLWTLRTPEDELWGRWFVVGQVVAFAGYLGALAVAEVGLTWLGVGVQAPHPSFGAMIFQGAGLTTLRAHPMLIMVPAIAVASLMLSFNLLGDALTDVFTPKAR